MRDWSPEWIAWERDNVGLQVGDRKQHVKNILVCLDVTAAVVTEAVRKKADLIISHHPLLFRPPSSLTTSDAVGRLVLSLAHHNISLYSAHTNLDFARDGVSMSLARALGLKNIRFLSLLQGLLAKIAVFVPGSHVRQVMNAMADAGAGTIGDYSHCSFLLNGQGTFLGSQQTNPFLGKAGKLETAEEARLEMILPRTAVSAVVQSMKSVHPYEEAAFDIYPLENEHSNFGMGAIGQLPVPLRFQSFVGRVKKNLGAEGLRFSKPPSETVQTIAVCGGSGSDLLPVAIRERADVFVTADVRYHTFLDMHGRIGIIDAGHWETEQVVLPVIIQRVKNVLMKERERISIVATTQRTNPIHFY